LNIVWLLAPKRAIIIKHGDPLLKRNKIRRASLSGLVYKTDDGLFSRPITLRR